MNFQEKLKQYAKLLVLHGLNVQEGQDVYIGAEIIHRDFVTLLVESAYQAGARIVSVDFHDPRNNRIRLLESKSQEFLKHVAPFIPYKYESMLTECAASLRIIGSEFPTILSDLDPKRVQTVEVNYKKSLKKYYEEGIGHSKVQWTVAAAATPAWGKTLFPDLSEQEAYLSLWNEIFRICRADQPNCLELWQEHNKQLLARAQKLTELKIKTLHFTGPETDLKVGLSPYARFQGGTSISPRKVHFEPNIPTEECFTTPDYHKTSGFVKTTRPFLINGKLIKNLRLVFKDGTISDFHAEEGEETFAAYIKSDAGSARLGEVALVGIDSPVYQSGKIFEEILYDENAACHIAIGSAYRFCISNSSSMSPQELEEIGCNTSSAHTDMMISSSEVDVSCETYSGETISLIKQGEWVWH